LTEVERFRELKGNLSLEQVFQLALSISLDRIDPLRKPQKVRPGQSTRTSESKTKATQTSQNVGSSASRYIPASLIQALFKRSGGRCEFVDPKTGRRCESCFRLQVDHIIPFSCGGLTNLDNTRHYCPNHNRLVAIEILGNKMNPFLYS
jgi:hypothetical protein